MKIKIQFIKKLYPFREVVLKTNVYVPLVLLYVVVCTGTAEVQNSAATNFQLYLRQSILA